MAVKRGEKRGKIQRQRITEKKKVNRKKNEEKK